MLTLCTWISIRFSNSGKHAQLPRPRFRRLCRHCLQPDFSCYCGWLQPFDCGIDFVILIHPLEFKKRIATGRMAHMSLRDSRLIMGLDYSRDPVVNELLADGGRQCLVLYPGCTSSNLTAMSHGERRGLLNEKAPVRRYSSSTAAGRRRAKSCDSVARS